MAGDSDYTISCLGKGGPIEQTVHLHVGTTATSTPATTQVGGVPVTMVDLGQTGAAPTLGVRPNFTRNLSLGMQGDEVKQFQQFLVTNGYLKIGLASGYFGTLTRTALMKYQKQKGIAPTGYFGPLTRSRANSI
jgi:peptidoglycan hydrolase-like protein with peptidoglycan-binding domain